MEDHLHSLIDRHEAPSVGIIVGPVVQSLDREVTGERKQRDPSTPHLVRWSWWQ